VADKIVIELSLEPSLDKKTRDKIEDQASSSGRRAGEGFEKNFNRSSRNIGKSLAANFTKVVAGIAAAVTAFRTLNQSIDLAVQQEAAITRLNNQLKLTGDFSRQTSLDLQAYAAQLQSISRFGDETILNQLALAKAFGANNEQAKEIVSTAIDLAAAFGIDLESATRNVAKTLGGFAGELGEVIPELKNLTQEQLQAGAGIDLLNKRFAGAGKNINDFDNITARLGNTFGDTLEEIGFFITKNETLLDGLKAGISIINDFGKGLRVIRKEILGITSQEGTALSKINEELTSTAKNINKLIETREGFKGGVLGTGVLVDTRAINNLNKQIDTLREKRQDLLKRREEILEQQKNQDSEAANSTESSVNKQISALQLFSQAQVTTEQSLIEIQNQRLAALGELRERDLIGRQEFNQLTLQITQDTNDKLSELERQRVERSIEANKDITKAVIRAAKTQGASLVDLGKQIVGVSINGFGRAFQNIGAALAQGENAAQAFIGSVKATFGEIASAIGDYYIKVGIAEAFINPARGGGLIAAGAALKILSGALGAGGTPSSGGSVNASGGLAAETFTSPDAFQTSGALDLQETEERSEPQTAVNINIQGDILDSEESGTRIAKVLSDAFGKQGIILNDARFA
jgi:hypothetical protein